MATMATNVYRCTFLNLQPESATDYRLRVRLLDRHEKADCNPGDIVVTSSILRIDFDTGYAFTRSGNLYTWEPGKAGV